MMMSFVVSCDGGVPDGAPTCGTSPAFAETVGSDPSADEADEEDVDGVSDEFIPTTPKDARATRANAKIEAMTMRGFFMGCTLSFTFASPVIDSRY
jgi:hypothetical protein